MSKRQIFAKYCPQCKKRFKFKAFKAEVPKRIYCGHFCANKASAGANSKAKIGKKNPMYGKRPANYKGIKINYHGYYAIMINGKDKLLHRLIWEAYHKRKLKPTEIIRHKDENKLNNDINNLILCKSECEHRLHHNKHGKGKKCHGPKQ